MQKMTKVDTTYSCFFFIVDFYKIKIVKINNKKHVYVNFDILIKPACNHTTGLQVSSFQMEFQF